MLWGRLVKRRWGYYITLLDRKHFKVKLLLFWRGRECSNQLHMRRNELWLILSGSGRMQIVDKLKNSKVTYLFSGGWIIAPQHLSHQFYAYNPSLVLEIQYGEKCDESDIVRVP